MYERRLLGPDAPDRAVQVLEEEEADRGDLGRPCATITSMAASLISPRKLERA
jgi:hypothetical protein